jgi:regulator of sigma E protease
MNLIHTLAAFLVALAILVFVHELGHFLAARACDVKVLRFSIGFGPAIARWRMGRDRTEWCISAFPLGGYVKMLGERDDDEQPADEANAHRAFSRQSLVRRSFIVVAGPVANLALAVAVYAGINLTGVDEPAPVMDTPAQESPAAAAGLMAADRIVEVDGHEVQSWNEMRLRVLEGVVEGRPIALGVRRGERSLVLQLPTPGVSSGEELPRDFLHTLGLDLPIGQLKVVSLSPDGAAARGGLEVGDEVVAIDGRPVARADEMVRRVRAAAGQVLAVQVRRDGREQRIEITPQGEPGHGLIGAGLANRAPMQTVQYGPLQAIGHSLAKTWEMSVFSLRMLGRMVIGELSWRNLSGPVAIADYAGQSARMGGLAYASFIALVSVSLAVLNLLPVPVLDGGHLVYYVLEAARGRPLSERMMQITQKAGLAIVGVLMVIALFNDLHRLISS